MISVQHITGTRTIQTAIINTLHICYLHLHIMHVMQFEKIIFLFKSPYNISRAET